MASNRKQRIYKLLKGIETGDTSGVSVVDEEKYIQHNPQTHEGSEGLAALFTRLSKTSPRVNLVRIFEDGDFVFAHTEYDFATRNIGFEIFRFESDNAVEHWDNIQRRQGPNSSAHTMVDGETEIADLEKTEFNRQVVQSFVEEVLIGGNLDKMNEYFNLNEFTEHNPRLSDDIADLRALFTNIGKDKTGSIRYAKCHRVLAEGNFVLSVCEGYADQKHSSFFDLYRLKSGKFVEHWDTTEAIPPQNEWKNHNGKF